VLGAWKFFLSKWSNIGLASYIAADELSTTRVYMRTDDRHDNNHDFGQGFYFPD
jgi:hypothetical protein